jgi:chorismate mutase
MSTSTAEDAIPEGAVAPEGADAPEGVVAPIGPVVPDESSTAIATLRGQIDAFDIAIIRLIAERARASLLVQTARMNAGGTRVELSRERVVLDTYRNSLGADGLQLGVAVLRVCRGGR